VADGDAVGVGDGDAGLGVRAGGGEGGEVAAQVRVEDAEAVGLAGAVREAEQRGQREDQVRQDRAARRLPPERERHWASGGSLAPSYDAAAVVIITVTWAAITAGNVAIISVVTTAEPTTQITAAAGTAVVARTAVACIGVAAAGGLATAGASVVVGVSAAGGRAAVAALALVAGAVASAA